MKIVVTIVGLFALALSGVSAVAQTNPGTSPLSVVKGGTGKATLTNRGVLLGQGTSGVGATAAMTNGQLLVGQTSADPLPKTITGDVTLNSAGASTLDKSISPTWTGVHQWTGSGALLPGGAAGGAPSLSVSTGVHPYFGSASNAWMLINSTAGSATVPEVGLQSVLRSSVGGGAPTSAFKIGMFTSCTADTGSADCYGVNSVTQLSSGVSGSIQSLAIEGDINVFNAHYGDSAGSPTQPFATPFYLAVGGDHRTTAMMMVNCGNNPTTCSNRGLVFFGGTIRFNTIEDYSTVSIGGFASASGSYADSVINAQAATGAYTDAIKLANNKSVTWRNAANSANIAGINLNGSNDLILGGTGVRSLSYTGSRSGGPAATFVNSNATAGDVGINLGAGSNGTADTTSLYMNFVTPDLSAQAGSVARADNAGTRRVVYNQTSDERLKRSIGRLDGALDRVMQIDVHKYVGLGYQGDDYQVGFFAQNLHRAYPWAVTTSNDPDYMRHPWQVDYGQVTPLLVSALQDSKHALDQLAARVTALERSRRLRGDVPATILKYPR